MSKTVSTHPNRSKQSIPVYARGGFDMRQAAPLGMAKDSGEALALARARVSAQHGGANGARFVNEVERVALEHDDIGRYYVAKRVVREV